MEFWKFKRELSSEDFQAFLEDKERARARRTRTLLLLLIITMATILFALVVGEYRTYMLTKEREKKMSCADSERIEVVNPVDYTHVGVCPGIYTEAITDGGFIPLAVWNDRQKQIADQQAALKKQEEPVKLNIPLVEFSLRSQCEWRKQVLGYSDKEIKQNYTGTPRVPSIMWYESQEERRRNPPLGYELNSLCGIE